MDGWTNRQNETKCKLVIFRFLVLLLLLLLSLSQLSQMCSIEEISLRVNVIIFFFFFFFSHHCHLDQSSLTKRNQKKPSSDSRINTRREKNQRNKRKRIYFSVKYETLQTDSVLSHRWKSAHDEASISISTNLMNKIFFFLLLLLRLLLFFAIFKFGDSARQKDE